MCPYLTHTLACLPLLKIVSLHDDDYTVIKGLYLNLSKSDTVIKKNIGGDLTLKGHVVRLYHNCSHFNKSIDLIVHVCTHNAWSLISHFNILPMWLPGDKFFKTLWHSLPQNSTQSKICVTQCNANLAKVHLCELKPT